MISARPAPNPLRRLGVVLEERFKRKPDGTIWSTGNFGDAFWERYLAVFDRIVVIARVEPWDGVTPLASLTSDPRVAVAAMPGFLGALGLARSIAGVSAALGEAITQIDCAALRLPGQLGMLAGPMLRRAGKPYLVELVGDPNGIFPAGIARRAAPVIRYVAKRTTASLIARSTAVSYVTDRTLQAICPAPPGIPTSSYSSLDLHQSFFEPAPIHPANTKAISLLSVGTLTSHYKGMDVLLEAVHRVIGKGYELRATVVGGGPLQSALEGKARALGLCDRVDFTGHLKRADVLDRMRSCDLYVQSSRSEGLARTVIEAMAAARPVIATRVGGLVELVPDEWLVPSADPDALAAAIIRAWPAATRARMSAASVQRARDFLPETLAQRRLAFYRAFVEAARNAA